MQAGKKITVSHCNYSLKVELYRKIFWCMKNLEPKKRVFFLCFWVFIMESYRMWNQNEWEKTFYEKANWESRVKKQGETLFLLFTGQWNLWLEQTWTKPNKLEKKMASEKRQKPRKPHCVFSFFLLDIHWKRISEIMLKHVMWGEMFVAQLLLNLMKQIFVLSA